MHIRSYIQFLKTDHTQCCPRTIETRPRTSELHPPRAMVVLLAAVALAGYLAMIVESCPLVSSVSPVSGSADPSFVYTISGAGLMGLSSLNSSAGSLNYTIVSDSTTRFSFQPGSSAMGRVVVRLISPVSTSCSPVTITVFVTIPCELYTRRQICWFSYFQHNLSHIFFQTHLFLKQITREHSFYGPTVTPQFHALF